MAARWSLVRGSLLPILRLHRRFGVTPRSEDPVRRRPDRRRKRAQELLRAGRRADRKAGSRHQEPGRNVQECDRHRRRIDSGRRPGGTDSGRGGAVWQTRPASEILSPREFEQITSSWPTGLAASISRTESRNWSRRASARKSAQGKFGSFKEYYEHVVADRHGEELIALLDALTTNFTSFLREAGALRFPAKDHPARPQSADPDLERGLFDRRGALHHRFLAARRAGDAAAGPASHILASDISTRALASGRAAASIKRSGSPACPPTGCEISAARFGSLGRMVSGQAGHSKHDRVPASESDGAVPAAQLFQVIFCRNVMIYFDKQTQEELVNRLRRVSEPGGYLLIGHSESLTGLTHPYEYVKPAVYRKPS